MSTKQRLLPKTGGSFQVQDGKLVERSEPTKPDPGKTVAKRPRPKVRTPKHRAARAPAAAAPAAKQPKG